MFEILGEGIVDFSNWIWGMPLLYLLMGGGAFFMIYCGFLPFTKLRHAIKVVSGKYDDENAPGQISSFQALTSAIAANSWTWKHLQG